MIENQHSYSVKKEGGKGARKEGFFFFAGWGGSTTSLSFSVFIITLGYSSNKHFYYGNKNQEDFFI